MSNKEPPNPLEEIQKQLKELFKDSNVKISAREFPEGDPFPDEPEEVVTDSKATTDGRQECGGNGKYPEFPAQTKGDP